MGIMCAKHHVLARYCGCDMIAQFNEAQAHRAPTPPSDAHKVTYVTEDIPWGAPGNRDWTNEDAEAVARAMCGYDLDWRDCETRCLQAGKCAGTMNEDQMLKGHAAVAALSARNWNPPTPPSDAVDRVALSCYDCGLTYAGEHWVEAVVPDRIWNEHLSPKRNEGGILCINCMAHRAVAEGLSNIPVQLTAGPFAIASMPDTSRQAGEVSERLFMVADSVLAENGVDPTIRHKVYVALTQTKKD